MALNRNNRANLLVYPSLVETPFITVAIGDYTFGVANKTKTKYGYDVDFPNYINSLTVEKINGAVNKYTLSIIYQITEKDDPNMFEKVFSSVSKTRRIVFNYGDWSQPTYIYAKEEGIIQSISTSFNAHASQITYTIKAISSCSLLSAVKTSFPEYHRKASDVLKEVIFNDQYKVRELFPGMTRANVEYLNLIPGDDTEVEIHKQVGISVIDYIKYLVNCMRFVGDTSKSGAKEYIYVITLDTNNHSDAGGEYFKVTKVKASGDYTYADGIASYEVNIGYPDKNLVMDFALEQSNNWSILYDYNKTVAIPRHTYQIDNDGNLLAVESNNLTMDYDIFKEDEADRNWWTQVTAFPIKAKLTIKGLMRPQLLMQYLKVNVWFYGHKHISSGIYCITKQVDTINSNGYKTELSLLRVASEETEETSNFRTDRNEEFR